MKLKKHFTWIVITVSALGLVFWLGSRKSDTPTALVYKTMPAGKGDVVQTVTASGPLSAVATVEVGSQVSGIISKLYVDFNDAVKAGQLIAEIDPSTYESRVVQAEGELASAKAALQLKQLNEKRSASLYAKQLLSESDYDQARVELLEQEATVRNREASLKSAQVDLSRCKIMAPINGTVISRDMDAGQTLQASFSAPKLFTLAQDLREMQITANVSEADIGGVEAGQPVSFTVDAFPGRKFTGKVRQVRNNPTTTNNVVNYYTIISVANADLKLRPGMTASVVITTAHRNGVVCVPNSALRLRLPEGAEIVKAAAPDLPAAAHALDEVKGGSEPMLEGPPADAPGVGPEGGPAAGGPGGPPAGFAMAKRSSSQVATVQTKVLYIAETAPDASGRAIGRLKAVTVRTGLSDTTRTEIISGLKEGEAVVLGQAPSGVAAAATVQQTNPFAPKPPPGAGPQSQNKR